MRSWLHTFDHKLTHAVQSWPDWVRPFMVLATLIGQPVFTIGTGTLVAGIGWGALNERLLIAGAVAVGTFGVGTIAKLYFRRHRPLTEYVSRMMFETYSMPSGHAAGAVASFGLLAVIACQLVPFPFACAIALFTAFLCWLIGTSRIYLGAHYPSDVIAGWLLGLAGLAVIILIVQPRL